VRSKADMSQRNLPHGNSKKSEKNEQKLESKNGQDQKYL